MDFDIGNFIYILLTLVFIILGSLGNKKKKRTVQEDGQPGDVAPESPSEGSVFEKEFQSILDQFGGQSQNKPAEEEVEVSGEESEFQKINRENIESGKVAAKDSDELYKMEDHIKDIMRNSNIKLTRHTKSGKNTFVKEAFKDFSPRKAILYTEVFKSKYF